MKRLNLTGSAIVFAAALAAQGSAFSQNAIAISDSAIALGSPVSVTRTASPAPNPNKIVEVVVKLADMPLALAVGANARRGGSTMTISQRIDYMAKLKAKQNAISAQIVGLGGTETASLGKAHNAVIFSTRVSTLPAIMRIPGVTSVRPVGTYSLHLTDSVPYIGAAALQAGGLTGAGVKVAVLDSGIDYTHKNLGGSGTAADYAAAIANPATIPAGLFPSAKVIGGYDFVGTAWPNGPRTSDPNPIDEPPAGGHGTHVADIIAGASLDGTHKGVAPGAQLYAVKVCSNQSSSCNGVALLLAMDWIIDPNGDLDFSDSPDVVNLSLGSSYGQREDDLTEAVSNAVRFGIVASISAGNSADRPYILGSPSSAPEAISVAQTQVPSASGFALRVNSPPAIAGLYGNTATLPWAPLGAGFTGRVKTATQAGGANNLACAPLPAGSLTGFVALVDRGTCNISSKVDAAANAGAIAVLVQLVAAGDAVSFSQGDGSNFVPSLVIQQSLGNAIKANINAPVTVTVSNATQVALVGSIVGSSSRGPSYSYNQIKPEIGAPGASVSADVGSGTGQSAFGGTSGAAPMVAGAAALLIQKFPNASGSEIKSRLMNGANSTIYTNPLVFPGVLAPITRIGAGEVRVDKSAAITTGVWDATNPYNVGLSFGTVRATGVTNFVKKVAVRNYSASPRTYTITRTFRYAADEANGAVTLTAPPSITVPANSTGAFTLSLSLNAALLPNWNLGAASNQGNGALLQGVEYDGYISLNDAVGSVSVPWHILPHKSAGVVVGSTSVSLAGTGAGTLAVANVGGATAGVVNAFALTGTSPQISNVLAPVGSQDVLIDLKAVGVRDAGDGTVQFAVTTYGQRSHAAYPVGIEIYVDTDNDGINDYMLFTAESPLGTFASTGQTLVYVQKLSSTTAQAFFFATVDLSSSNTILTAPLANLGINTAQPFTYSVYVRDNYFTDTFKDSIVGMKHTLGQQKFNLDLLSFSLPVGAGGNLAVTTVLGGAAASPAQSGFLLLYNDGKTGRESDVVIVTP